MYSSLLTAQWLWLNSVCPRRVCCMFVIAWLGIALPVCPVHLMNLCALQRIMHPSFDSWFQRYIYCLFVYIACFSTYSFFFTFSSLISSPIYLLQSVSESTLCHQVSQVVPPSPSDYRLVTIHNIHANPTVAVKGKVFPYSLPSVGEIGLSAVCQYSITALTHLSVIRHFAAFPS